MPKGNKRNRRSTIHRSTHRQGEQNETKNVAMAWIDYKEKKRRYGLKIGQNSEKSPADQIAVTQTPVEDPQIAQV